MRLNSYSRALCVPCPDVATRELRMEGGRSPKYLSRSTGFHQKGGVDRGHDAHAEIQPILWDRLGAPPLGRAKLPSGDANVAPRDPWARGARHPRNPPSPPPTPRTRAGGTDLHALIRPNTAARKRVRHASRVVAPPRGRVNCRPPHGGARGHQPSTSDRSPGSAEPLTSSSRARPAPRERGNFFRAKKNWSQRRSQRVGRERTHLFL